VQTKNGKGSDGGRCSITAEYSYQIKWWVFWYV